MPDLSQEFSDFILSELGEDTDAGIPAQDDFIESVVAPFERALAPSTADLTGGSATEMAVDLQSESDSYVGDVISNIPSSASRFAGDIFNAIIHPVETATSLVGLAKGVASKLIPGDQDSEIYVDGLMQFYKERYGTLEKAKETFRTDPVGALSDGAAALSGAGASLKLGRLGKAGELVARTASAIDPVNLPVGVARGAVATASDLTSPLGRVTKAAEKGEKLTTEILQPGKTSPTFERDMSRAFGAIEEVDSFKGLSKNLGEAKSAAAKERNALISGNNFPVDDSYIKRLENVIEDKKSRGQITEGEIRQMESVLDQERSWLERNPLDRAGAQSRKEFLADKSDSFLKKKEKGTLTGEESTRMSAIDELRQGLRESVEGPDATEAAKIKDLNDTYAGLRKAEMLAEGQLRLSKKSISDGRVASVVQKVLEPAVNALRGQGVTTAFFVAKQSAKMEKRLSKITDEIARLRNISKGQPSAANLSRIRTLEFTSAVLRALRIGEVTGEETQELKSPSTEE